jgi:hypothetical protein
MEVPTIKANFIHPLRYPGRRAVVGSDYWSNERNYTHIEQPHVHSQNIKISERRVCCDCKSGGVVQVFFHDNNKQCHDFEIAFLILIFYIIIIHLSLAFHLSFALRKLLLKHIRQNCIFIKV